jgi:hypothetical protein
MQFLVRTSHEGANVKGALRREALAIDSSLRVNVRTHEGSKEQAELLHGLRSRPVLTGSMPRGVADIRTAIAANLTISPASRAPNASSSAAHSR